MRSLTRLLTFDSDMVQTRSQRANKLRSPDKKAILRGYANGMNSSEIAKVIGAKPATIRKQKQRYGLIKDLPPKEKKSRSKINARVGLAIKRAVSENPLISIRKLPGILRESLPNEPWIPQKTAVAEFLKVNGIIKRHRRHKCPINERNRIKRLIFANQWLINGRDTLGNVMWTDETRVRLFSS